jgi:hypothetical protein
VAESKQVFLHIGAPKTGTTYLQRVLAANRERLGEHGVLYPRVGGEAHHVAAWGLRPDGSGMDAANFGGHWRRLVDEVTSWEGPKVVVSSEMFAFLRQEIVSQVVSAFPDAELHVVYTARDLSRQVPAVWQEQVKNQATQGYRSFVLDLLGPRATSMARHFWRAQDAAKVLRRWSGEGVARQHIHVVTAPQPGGPPTLLWERFAAAVGVDPGLCDAEMPAANTSLSVAGAEVLRRYNARHAGDLPIRVYRRRVKSPLVPMLLQGVSDRSKLPLSNLQRRMLARQSRRIVAAIESNGYDVVGSLEDLLPPTPGRLRWGRAGTAPDDLSDEQVIDALLDVVHTFLETQRQQDRRGRREEQRKSRVAPGRPGQRRRRRPSA